MNIIDLRRCLFKVADQVGPLIRLNNFNKGGSTQAIHVDGKILIAPHGFLAGKETSEEKKSIEKYKQEYASFWSEQLGTGGEFDTKEDKENE